MSLLGQREVVAAEHCVYGSFAGAAAGYTVRSQSPGCPQGGLEAWRLLCRSLGDPQGDARVGGFFSAPLSRSHWAITSVIPLGSDDLGRPDAVAFHGLFLTQRDFRGLAADPFAWRPHLAASRADLPDCSKPIRARVRDLRTAHSANPAHQPPIADAIAAALIADDRVVVPAAAPIDQLAEAVLARLSVSERLRIAVCTWSFAASAQFQLIGMPERIARAAAADGLPITLSDTLDERRLESSIIRRRVRRLFTFGRKRNGPA